MTICGRWRQRPARIALPPPEIRPEAGLALPIRESVAARKPARPTMADRPSSVRARRSRVRSLSTGLCTRFRLSMRPPDCLPGAWASARRGRIEPMRALSNGNWHWGTPLVSRPTSLRERPRGACATYEPGNSMFRAGRAPSRRMERIRSGPALLPAKMASPRVLSFAPKLAHRAHPLAPPSADNRPRRKPGAGSSTRRRSSIAPPKERLAAGGPAMTPGELSERSAGLPLGSAARVEPSEAIGWSSALRCFPCRGRHGGPNERRDDARHPMRDFRRLFGHESSSGTAFKTFPQRNLRSP